MPCINYKDVQIQMLSCMHRNPLHNDELLVTSLQKSLLAMEDAPSGVYIVDESGDVDMRDKGDKKSTPADSQLLESASDAGGATTVDVSSSKPSGSPTVSSTALIAPYSKHVMSLTKVNPEDAKKALAVLDKIAPVGNLPDALESRAIRVYNGLRDAERQGITFDQIRDQFPTGMTIGQLVQDVNMMVQARNALVQIAQSEAYWRNQAVFEQTNNQVNTSLVGFLEAKQYNLSRDLAEFKKKASKRGADAYNLFMELQFMKEYQDYVERFADALRARAFKAEQELKKLQLERGGQESDQRVLQLEANGASTRMINAEKKAAKLATENEALKTANQELKDKLAEADSKNKALHAAKETAQRAHTEKLTTTQRAAMDEKKRLETDLRNENAENRRIGERATFLRKHVESMRTELYRATMLENRIRLGEQEQFENDIVVLKEVIKAADERKAFEAEAKNAEQKAADAKAALEKLKVVVEEKASAKSSAEGAQMRAEAENARLQSTLTETQTNLTRTQAALDKLKEEFKAETDRANNRIVSIQDELNIAQQNEREKENRLRTIMTAMSLASDPADVKGSGPRLLDAPKDEDPEEDAAPKDEAKAVVKFTDAFRQQNRLIKEMRSEDGAVITALVSKAKELTNSDLLSQFMQAQSLQQQSIRNLSEQADQLWRENLGKAVTALMEEYTKLKKDYQRLQQLEADQTALVKATQEKVRLLEDTASQQAALQLKGPDETKAPALVPGNIHPFIVTQVHRLAIEYALVAGDGRYTPSMTVIHSIVRDRTWALALENALAGLYDSRLPLSAQLGMIVSTAATGSSLYLLVKTAIDARSSVQLARSKGDGNAVDAFTRGARKDKMKPYFFAHLKKATTQIEEYARRKTANDLFAFISHDGVRREIQTCYNANVGPRKSDDEKKQQDPLLTLTFTNRSFNDSLDSKVVRNLCGLRWDHERSPHENLIGLVDGTKVGDFLAGIWYDLTNTSGKTIYLTGPDTKSKLLQVARYHAN